MAEEDVKITNDLGLHARPASQIAQTASKFGADVHLCYGDRTVDAKSILGILTLAAPKGAQLRIVTEGDDAKDAAETLAALFADGFGET